MSAAAEKDLEDVQNALTKYIERTTIIVVEDATVNAIDLNEFTADVTTVRGVEKFGIRLKTGINSDAGVLVLPAIGSHVLILKIDDDDYLLLSADVLDSFKINIGATSLTLNAQGLTFNKGSLGGVLIAPNLLTQLNLLNNAVNELLTSLSGLGSQAQTAFEIALANAATGINIMPKAQFNSQLIDNKITH